MSRHERECQKIVMDVLRRRAAGDRISDQEVIAKHPLMADELRVELERARQLQQAANEAMVESKAAPSRDEASHSTDVVKSSRETVVDARPDDDAAESLPQIEEESDDNAGPDVRMTVFEPDFDPRGTLRIDDDAMAGAPGAFGVVAPEDDDADRAELFRPIIRPPMAFLKVLADDQESFQLCRIEAAEFTIGRETGDFTVTHDRRISARHVQIQRRDVDGGYRWMLVDLNSKNGTFVRADRVRLKDGGELMIGRGQYQFHIDDDTSASLQEVHDGGSGQLWQLGQQDRWLGRALSADMCRDDPLLEKKHAHFFRDGDGRWCVKDARSLNGVWVRITEIALPTRSAFQIGEQRFVFWVP